MSLHEIFFIRSCSLWLIDDNAIKILFFRSKKIEKISILLLKKGHFLRYLQNLCTPSILRFFKKIFCEYDRKSLKNNVWWKFPAKIPLKFSKNTWKEKKPEKSKILVTSTKGKKIPEVVFHKKLYQTLFIYPRRTFLSKNFLKKRKIKKVDRFFVHRNKEKISLVPPLGQKWVEKIDFLILCPKHAE